MNEKYVIYTSIFSNYDELVDPPKNEFFDYVCFTDNEKLKSKIWKIIHIKSKLPIKLLNRKYKFLPHRYLSKYKWSIYIDGNITIMSTPVEMVNKYFNEYKISAPSHQERNCIYDEANFLKKYNNILDVKTINEQIKSIEKYNYPKNNGLNEFNLICRMHNSPEIIRSMEESWLIFKKYQSRDQLIFNFVLWKNNVQIQKIEESSRVKNKFFRAVPHLNNKNLLKKIFNIFWYRRYHNKLFYLISKIIFKIYKK